MCGIIGVVSRGQQSVVPSILDSLVRLSSRGYDSAGLSVQEEVGDTGFHIHKCAGKLDNLLSAFNKKVFGFSGIGHNRWATHGMPNDINAHPHMSSDGSVSVVHNGIIKNHKSLRISLERDGYKFLSETDTEVLPNLIHQALENGTKNLVEAVMNVLPKLNGSKYAFLVMSKKFPGEIVAATYQRPLILGVGDKNYALASDELGLVGLSDSVVNLNDYDLVSIKADGYLVYEWLISGNVWKKTDKQLRPIAATNQDISKGDFSTFLESEIFQQPKTVERALDGRMENGELDISGLDDQTLDFLKSVTEITAVGCGTSLNALFLAKRFFLKYANITLNVELASELPDSELRIDSKSLVIAVSQSGETADTVKAILHAKKLGAHILAITNCASSLLVNQADASINLQAGPEISVASTKAYTAQVVTLFLLAIKAGLLNGKINSEKAEELFVALEELPEQIEQVLLLAPKMKEIAEVYGSTQRIMVIGQGYSWMAARECVLKILELTYTDAHYYASGELKHGPLALVTEGVLVISLALNNGLTSPEIISHTEEARTRGADVLALVTIGSEEEELIAGTARYILSLPKAMEEMTPVLSVITMQLFALYLGTKKGVDVDKPRNLAKTVTVE